MFGNIKDWEEALLGPKPTLCDHADVTETEVVQFFLAHNPPSKQVLVEKFLKQYRVIYR